LIGDGYQLIPVYGKPLITFSSSCEDEFSKDACNIYKQFFPVFYLNENKRLAKREREFKKVLNELRTKQMSQSSVDLLESRRQENIFELAQFKIQVFLDSMLK
jgi:hypothetical protein